MAVYSEEGHVPDHLPSRKDYTLFAPIMLPSAETGKETRSRPMPIVP